MYHKLKESIADLTLSYPEHPFTILAFLSTINTKRLKWAPVVPEWDQGGTVIVTLAFGQHRAHIKNRRMSKTKTDFMSGDLNFPEDDLIASASTAILSCRDAIKISDASKGADDPAISALRKLRGKHYFSERFGGLTCTIRHDMVYSPREYLFIPLKFHDSWAPHTASFIPAGIRYIFYEDSTKESTSCKLYFKLLSKNAVMAQSQQIASQAISGFREEINIAVALSTPPLKPWVFDCKLNNTAEFCWLDTQLISSEVAQYSLDCLQEMMDSLKDAVATDTLTDAVENLSVDSPWTMQYLATKNKVTICRLILNTTDLPSTLQPNDSTWRDLGEPTLF